ncbi:hypothetical protein RHVP.R15 [Cricetid gammaherpesvirus 2]|uniref:Uncharacterized protein n=1 Tax=Cricetid gammaherpesvirus 2 TaxID=1605972 RepID=E9M5P8_9GAMA|nr:hypothetical protein RHVP.R15 [Cricetid gammaherpesvirus 2]ADW24406.1 hypothetical protein RHVP.R15 [Cricetid gammaherpesvirus 2]ADW24488.1 hypothetical protein RHVP-L.R15 [Cricetid gammaherpesvirus 2]
MGLDDAGELPRPVYSKEKKQRLYNMLQTHFGIALKDVDTVTERDMMYAVAERFFDEYLEARENGVRPWQHNINDMKGGKDPGNLDAGKDVGLINLDGDGSGDGNKSFSFDPNSWKFGFPGSSSGPFQFASGKPSGSIEPIKDPGSSISIIEDPKPGSERPESSQQNDLLSLPDEKTIENKESGKQKNGKKK